MISIFFLWFVLIFQKLKHNFKKWKRYHVTRLKWLFFQHLAYSACHIVGTQYTYKNSFIEIWFTYRTIQFFFLVYSQIYVAIITVKFRTFLSPQEKEFCTTELPLPWSPTSLSPKQPLTYFLPLWLAYSGHYVQMKWHNIWPFVTSFFHLSCFQSPSTLYPVSVFLSLFSWLSDSSLCGFSTPCLTIISGWIFGMFLPFDYYELLQYKHLCKCFFVWT